MYGDPSVPILLKTFQGNRQLAGDGEMGGDSVARKDRLALAPWKYRTAAYPGRPGYYDNDWKYSKQPLQMGADGDGTAEAWYRTNLHADADGIYTLQVEGGDRATAFVDGRPAGSGDIRDGEITFNLSK